MNLNVFLIFLVYFSFLNISSSCTCTTIGFCEYVNSEESFLAFKGTVIKHFEFPTVNNGFGGQVIYVEITKKYKDNTSVGDTIKLYGSSDGVSCTPNLIQGYPVGSTIIAVAGISGNTTSTNLDSLNEHYWDMLVDFCFFRTLRFNQDDETVSGYITPIIRKYPLDLFESNISDCNYSYDQVMDFDCSADKLNIYPNPSLDGKIFIESDYFSNSISSIEIYHIDGSPVSSFQSYEKINTDRIQVKGFRYGVNILKLKIDDEVCLRYIISNRTD